MTEPQHDQQNPEESDLFDFAGSLTTPAGTDLEATVRRVQRATGNTQPDTDRIPSDLKHQIWEDLMHAQAIPAASPPTGIPGAIRRVGDRIVTHDTSPPFGHRRWQVIANAAIAAMLVLAITAGIWRATGGWNFGGGDNQEPVPFGGFVNQEATPNATVDPATLPKAEDCTVEPLTVDEVLWYTQNPEEAARSKDIDNPAPPTPEWFPATPPATDAHTYYSGPPSDEDIAAVSAQQRMVMACILADSWFQIWALEHPSSVSQQVSSVVPPLAGVDEARAILEDLEANGPAPNSDRSPNKFSAPSAIGYGGLPIDAITVIDTTPGNIWQEGNQIDGKPSGPGDSYTTAGYNVYGADGTLLDVTTIDTADPLSLDQCKSFMFIWNEARGVWLYYPALFCA